MSLILILLWFIVNCEDYNFGNRNMCDLLRPTVHKTVCDYAYRAGINNPKLVVTEASKNGESYSGEVYRVVMTPNDQDQPDHTNNNNNINGKL